MNEGQAILTAIWTLFGLSICLMGHYVSVIDAYEKGRRDERHSVKKQIAKAINKGNTKRLPGWHNNPEIKIVKTS